MQALQVAVEEVKKTLLTVPLPDGLTAGMWDMEEVTLVALNPAEQVTVEAGLGH